MNRGNTVKERRNGNGARVYGVNLDGKAWLTDGMWLCKWVLRFSAAVIPNTRIGVRTKIVEPTKFMPRTPDYYGYFTLTSAPFKNFDMSVSGVYTGRMHVPSFGS